MSDKRVEYRGAALLALADSYALDAVSDEERMAIDTGLAAADAVTRTEFTIAVRDIHETMAFACSADQTAPPADLRSRLLSELSQTAQPKPVQQESSVISLDSHRANRKSWRGTILAAAAAVVIAVGGVVVGVQVLGSSSPNVSTPEALQVSEAQQVLAAADVHTSKLDFPGGGIASVSYSPSRDSAVVTLNGVATPVPGKSYQMWLIDGTPRSVGVLTDGQLAPSDPAVVKDVGNATDFAFSLEPAGGSATPTEVLGAVSLVA